MCSFKGCFVCRTLGLDYVPCKQKVCVFLTVTDSLLKRFGYLEHCVYSERMCYCPKLFSPIKWYAYARNCMGPSYFRQNEITRRMKYYLWAYIQE